MSNAKRGLARNPLELVLGRSSGALPAAEPPIDAAAEPVHEAEAPSAPERHEAEEPAFEDVASETLEVAPEAPRAPERSQTPAQSRARRTTTPRRVRPAEQPMVQSPEAVRVGTIKRPYLRMDGIAMRQVSLSLPVDLMQQANICAIKQGLRSNELVQLAIEQYLRDFGA